MANNCLVTKLKGSVDNDSLDRLGCVKIKILARNTVATIGFGFNGKTATLVGNATFLDGDGSTSLGKSVTLEDLGYMRISPSNEDVYVFVEGKYSNCNFITTVSANPYVEFDLSQIKYATSAAGVMECYMQNGLGIYGDMSSFISLNPKNISLGGTTVTLKDSSIFDLFTNLMYLEVNLPNKTVAFKDFAKAPKLVNLRVCSANVTGSAEEFVATALEARNGAAGSVGLYWPHAWFANVTYNGKRFADPTSGVPNSVSTKLNWDAQGNITWTT